MTRQTMKRRPAKPIPDVAALFRRARRLERDILRAVHAMDAPPSDLDGRTIEQIGVLVGIALHLRRRARQERGRLDLFSPDDHRSARDATPVLRLVPRVEVKPSVAKVTDLAEYRARK